MQILLTEDEYQQLLEGAQNKVAVEDRDEVLKQCFELLKPDLCCKTYCDDCPIKDIGRAYYGAPNNDHLLCKQSQYYSK